MQVMIGSVQRSLVIASCMLLVAVSWVLPLSTAAQDEPLSYKEQATISSATFMAGHPDMSNRIEGWNAYESGDYASAHESLAEAARFGDKPSQAMLAELFWRGEGVQADRARAYAWMDLAAERGYPVFLAKRESYWDELTAEERARVQAIGQDMLDQYGDAVTSKRLDDHIRRHALRLRRSSRSVTPPMEVRVPAGNGMMVRINSALFRSPKFWDPKQYRAWQDQVWKAPARTRVDVGDLQTVRGEQPESDE